MDHNNASEGEDEVPALHSSNPTLKHDLLNLSDHASAHVYPSPPAHLAARLYRASVNRKRSSNASSRRNSISSSQSHQSNRSRPGRATNNHHVAQYLRRASILENRKARLADRAAHAEQVRMRAALAKAPPKPANTEAKFEAAQQARQKMLAKVAATCAEAVAHAKKVAEETREKKAEAERKSRLELEEKHAEAERRRQEYKKVPRKPRSRSEAASDGKKSGEQSRDDALSPPQAATKIQRAWRHYLRRSHVDAFLKLDLTIERVGRLTFIEASDLLSADQVLLKTKNMMKLLALDTGSDADQSAVRRFLSAYMILGHATDIFPNHGQQEEDLMEKAKEVLISFENLLSEISCSPRRIASATQLETLIQCHATYLTAFEAWKSKDATALIDIMVDQFVAFDSIWQTVKDDTSGEVAADYRDAIREQQVVLLSKIKKLAGAEDANKRIRNAIRESRRARMRHRRPTGDLRPRPIVTTEGASGQQQGDVPAAAAAEEIEQQETAAAPSQDELSRIFSILPPNRVVVHELMMDPSYRIEVSPDSDVRSALNREVCNKMRVAVQQGDGTVWTLAVAENIRKRLLKLLKPGNSMHRLLSDVLDAEHIRNQCVQGIFSYEKFFGFMADLLPKLCAPFRDQEVRTLAEVLQRTGDDTDAMIEKLFGLLHIIDLMTLDYSNYMMQQAAPTLVQQGPQYEQRQFAHDLEQGICTLERTKRWWSHATLSLLTESTTMQTTPQFSGEFAAAVQTAAGTFARIYSRGLIDLIVAAGRLPAVDVPETLQFDVSRLGRIRADLTRYTTVGAIMLTAKNLLRRDVRSQWKPEAKRIYDTIVSAGYENSDNSLTSRICGIIEATHGMPATSRTHLERATTRFLAEAASGRPPADPVVKLLVQRLRSSLFTRLVAGTYQGASSSERVRVASSTGEALAGIGLVEFVANIAACADEAARVANVDLSAHSRWYRDVAQEVERSGDRGWAV